MNQNQFNKAIEDVTNPLPGSVPKAITYRLAVKKKYEGLSIVDFFSKAVPRSTPDIWIDKVKSGNLTVNDNNAHYLYTTTLVRKLLLLFYIHLLE